MAVENSALGTRIKELRKQKGLSQFEVAEAAGIDPKSLSRIESGVFNPAIDTLHGLAVALGVEMQDFFLSETTWLRLQRAQLLETIANASAKEIRDLTSMVARLTEGRKRARKPRP